MRVQFLGSGDAFGSGGRFQTCILMECEGFRCLLDCGASSLIPLKRAGIDPNGVDAILISHLHGDHFGGIPFFIIDAQFARRSKPLLIAGPPGLGDRITRAMDVFFPGSASAPQKFHTEFMELSEGTRAPVGPLSVTPYEMIHASGAPPYAFRIEIEGRVLAYSGDTEWTDNLVNAAAGADLFICEAYFYDKQVRFHLDCMTLVRRRPELDCKRIIVTHMSPDTLAHLPDLSLHGIEAAEDGMEVSL